MLHLLTPLALASIQLCVQPSIQLEPQEPPVAARLSIVESFPLETTLDAPDLPQTTDVWLDTIRGAKKELLLAHFYASTADGSPLNQVIDEIEAAAARGVQVRFLLSDRFRKTYPDVPARLAKADGVDVRFVDFKKVAGGIMHAKYMVTDRERVFFGSPNFDFRSLNHIQELGLDVANAEIAISLARIFSLDWVAAGGDALDLPEWQLTDCEVELDLDASQAQGAPTATSFTLACSPEKHLPIGVAWDLPLIVSLIDGAKESVRAQVLTYDATGYDRQFFPDLENALRRAAARGVRVQLIVADWCKRKSAIDGIQSLAALNGIDVHFAVIPDWSEEFIPFARVAHPKFCVADENLSWVGTSNWERSYFTSSRNVGAIIAGEGVGKRLARWFDRTFTGEYAEPVVPGKAYEPRKRE